MSFALQISFVWIAAFVLALMPLQAQDAIFFMTSFLVLAAAFIQSMLQDGHFPRRNALLLCGLAFWALAFISAFLSQAPYVSYLYFCFFSVMPLSFLLPLVLQDRESFFKYSAYGLGFIFAALAVFSVAEYFLLPKWLNHGSLYWPLTDPNSFAMIYCLAFFCAFGLMIGGRTRRESNTGLVLSMLFITCVFMSGSKGVLFCLSAALVICVALALPHIKKHKKCCAILAVFSAVLFAALVFHFGASPQKAFWLKYSSEYGFYPRNSLLFAAWDIGWQHLWTGTGIGTFFLYYPSYRQGDTISAGFMAHNDPLQFFSELGLLGPILFYAFLVLALARTVKALKATPADSIQRIQILAPFCGLGAMAVHCHINYDLNVLSILILAGWLMAFWYTRTQISSEEITLGKNVRAVPAFILLAAAVCFAALQGSEILTNSAQRKLADGNVEGFMHDVNMADKLALGRNARAIAMAASVPIVVLETSKDQTQAQRHEYALRAEELLTRAEKLNPRLPGILYYRARLYTVRPGGSPRDPEQLLRQALALDPMHMVSRQMLAELLAKQGKMDEALALMKEGLRWPVAMPDYYLTLARLAKQAGDEELQDTALAKMLVGQGRQIQRDYQQSELRSTQVLE